MLNILRDDKIIQYELFSDNNNIVVTLFCIKNFKEAGNYARAAHQNWQMINNNLIRRLFKGFKAFPAANNNKNNKYTAGKIVIDK